MEIRAFRGWRFRPGPDGTVSDYLAPPYDILSADDKQALLARSGQNIVAVDLPYVPPKEAGPDEGYRAAADLLAGWRADGVLVREDRPAVYVYRQDYAWAGRTYARTAMLCGVRATELGADVVPHEHTFPGPRADRLKLTEHTRMQLSPIFGFFHDSAGRVSARLAAAAQTEPIARGRLNETTETLWTITDPAAVEAVAEALRGERAFIADGHHRYATALTYCRALRSAGKIDEDHEANFVLFALVPDSDPGLVIRPTHRIVRGLSEDFAMDKLILSAKAFSWQQASPGDMDLRDSAAALARFGPGAMTVVAAGSADVWVVRLANPKVMAEAVPDKTAAWRELGVAILHELIIERALAPWRTDDLYIEYTPDPARVAAACASGAGQLGVCLQPTALSSVREVGLAGEAMPHKTTYFYPKLSTGMVLKPLE